MTILSSHQFTDNVSDFKKDLWLDDHFLDVILATEDDKQIQAHKAILCSYSTKLKNMLKCNLQTNTLIYLKGIKSSTLQNVLQFIYLGECEIRGCELEDFITLGRDLNILGIINLKSDVIESKEEIYYETNKHGNKATGFLYDEYFSDKSSILIQDVEGKNKKSFIHDLQNTQLYGLDLHQENNMEINYDMIAPEITEPSIISTEESDHSNIQSHVQHENNKINTEMNYDNFISQIIEPSIFSNEYSDINEIQCQNQDDLYLGKLERYKVKKLQCDKCDNRFIDFSHLSRHISGKHEKNKIYCEQCQFSCLDSGYLKKHVMAKHDGIKFNCKICEREFEYASLLKTHTKRVHEFQEFVKCDECINSFRGKLRLYRHKQKQHGGKKYYCDQCNYKTSSKGNLTIHIKRVHANKI